MKFYAYSVSDFGKMEYVGTWFADCYAAAVRMISSETGLNISNLKIVGKVYR
jgi:hypothetical protein